MTAARPAFVAGATGYTGRAVVEELRRRGVATVAHVRPGSSSLDEVQPRFEATGADIDLTPWEPDPMEATLRRVGPGVVFSLLGTTRKQARSEGLEAEEGYRRVDYGLTSLLIDAAVASGCRPRFVYLSAIGADPESPDAGNAYVRARSRAEAKLGDSGLSYTVVRPSFVTGSDRRESRPLERIGAVTADALLAAAALLGGRGVRDRYASMDAATLARALVTAALDPACAGRTLDAAELRAVTRRGDRARRAGG